MEQRISGREIIMFIAMFGLWDAWITTDGLPEGGIEFRKRGSKFDGYDEISYGLHANGKYDIEVWIEPGKEIDGRWEQVQTGDIFSMGVYDG